MTVDDWHDGDRHAFACQIVPAAGTRCLIVFNPEIAPVSLRLPDRAWALALDSSGELPDDLVRAPAQPLTAPAQSLLVLREQLA